MTFVNDLRLINNASSGIVPYHSCQDNYCISNLAFTAFEEQREMFNHFACNSKIIEASKRTVIVENNKTAQLASVIREKTGKEIEHKILKYDGRQFFPTEIYQRVKEVL